MKLYILTEGFAFTGYGHVARCLAIAKSFRNLGIEVTFIVNGDENVRSQLHDFPLIASDWPREYPALQRHLSVADFLLVDSYLAPKNVYDDLAARVPMAIFIDDYNRLDYPAGIIVNGTVGAEAIPYDFKPRRLYLLGGDFVILRDAFKHLPRRSEISEEITRVLVTFGGTDPLNVTPRVLRLLTTFFPTWEKTVVLGAAFSDVRTVESLADSRTKLLRNLTAGEMRDAMMTCDLAISAAGQTINELAATGLPSIVFKVAGNQTYNIAGWKKYGFIDAYLDATAEWDDSQLCDALRSLASAEVRRRMSLRGQEAMDGCGPDRLAKRVLRQFALEQLSLRPAADEDASRLFELANDALVRQNSFSTKTIAWDEHRAWFARLLADEGRRLYVFFVKNEFLGQVRFDSDGWRDAVISISLASAFRGWGLASVVLQKAVAAIRHEHAALQHINAYVKPANVASRLAFEKAGFRPAECERADSLKFIYSYA